MLVPSLLYSFFLFLKLAVRLGLTGELVAAWPLILGLTVGVNLWRLDSRLSVFSYQLSVKGLSVFGLPVKETDKPKTDKLGTENRQPRTDNWSTSQNILFAAGWAVVALFGMTSTIGWLGRGVVLGVGLQLAVRVAKDFPHRLDWFYQPIKRQLTNSEKKWGAVIFLAIFTILSLF